MLRQIVDFQSREATGPFGRPGWIEELFSWVQHEIDPYGLRLSGEFRQLNASPTFALLRFETNAQAVWFKAVGEPNLREFPISVTLSSLFPGFVPTVIAFRPDWNGWLTTDFDGSTLDEVSDGSSWERAVSTLAELQIVSTEQTGQLLQAGCRNLRVASLLTLVDPFIEVTLQLMGRQQKIPSPILGEKELCKLGKQIKNALSQLGETNIPDTLGHLDFNPGNILCSADQCVFLDWAEAYVGPPFLTFQYLLEHLSRSTPQGLIGSCHLGDHYFSSWSCNAPRGAVAVVRRLMPLLALFACATAATGPGRNTPQTSASWAI